MSYPLVLDLAAGGIPVSVTCRVLKIARQPYYRWLAHPVTDAELTEAHRANALFDAHRDDPEFGYRFLADEAREAGQVMSERTAWKICAANRWWSAFGKKRGKNGKKPGPPVHDDRCAVVDEKGRTRHEFTAGKVNEVWIGDITEHWTGEGKLYLCAFKDVFSNRVVGYSIDSRMKSRLAVNALNNAVARRGVVTGCVVHTDRGSQFRSRKFVGALNRHHMIGSMGRVGRLRRQRRHGELLLPAPEERPEPAHVDHPRRAPDGDRHLDRTHLAPTPAPRRTGPVDPHRVRDHHDHDSQSGCVTNHCHQSVQQTPAGSWAEQLPLVS
jgi:putative transposase